MNPTVSSDSLEVFEAPDYDLGATLNSGQAFRWQAHGTGWVGIIAGRWVRLESANNSITVQTALKISDWNWLRDYLQLDLQLDLVLSSFPADGPMEAAKAACCGLRLLRQDPWECLASFILSSTKQIVQIRQMISLLCERFGESIPVPPGHAPAWSFPSACRLAVTGEAELRACKLGFRAPYLLETAKKIAENPAVLPSPGSATFEETRLWLMELPGVGRKIADCVLLFAYGFQGAFPIDVWVLRALRELYFPRRRPNLRRLQAFAGGHFGPNAGYAQQYLFHYMRTKRPKSYEAGKVRRAVRFSAQKGLQPARRVSRAS
jgi:N-glycosylase/DNA lyase